MKQTTVRSRCECQALLVATLNDARLVLTSSAVVGGESEPAPAHTIGAHRERFDVGWLCPACGRNVLRSFSSDALEWVTAPSASTTA